MLFVAGPNCTRAPASCAPALPLFALLATNLLMPIVTIVRTANAATLLNVIPAKNVVTAAAAAVKIGILNTPSCFYWLQPKSSII